MPGFCPGSIPACAGEPIRIAGPPPRVEVYPRVCGGTVRTSPMATATAGLSPRVRGNRRRCRLAARLRRSIPACAGEPERVAGGVHAGGVYPRVCGGTSVRHHRCGRPRGLSPRVRGNRVRPPEVGDGGGSIPACAGEPRKGHCAENLALVYPRVCGGTERPPDGPRLVRGLSPRVRGNLIGRTP